MSMIIDSENKILRFDVPNSEASIDAQHNGIKKRTVGQYYMSDNYGGCRDFFSRFDGDFYLDILLSVSNAKKIVELLLNKNYQEAFKSKLVPQQNQIIALEWSISDNNDAFHKFNPPAVNDQQKYLKLDPNDPTLSAFKTLVLGDICSVYFKKLGKNGYIMYMDKSPKFDEIMDSNKILDWMI